GCELWAAHPRGRQGLGYIHDAGGNRHQTGSQFLSLYSGPHLRHLSDAVSRRPHWGTSQNAQPRCLLGYILTMPRIIEEIRSGCILLLICSTALCGGSQTSPLTRN